jgi:hypothetical protein
MARTQRYMFNFLSNINFVKKIKTEFFIIHKVFLTLFLAQIQNFYAGWYHNFPRSIQMEIFLGVVIAVILTLPVLACSIFFSASTTRFIAGLSLLFAICILLGPYFAEGTGKNYLTALIIVLISLSAVSLCYLSDRAWHKSAAIIQMAILAWGLSPLLLAWIQSDQTTHRTFTVERITRYPPKAVVVLVLDEMSPELAPLLRPVLTTPGHKLHVGQVIRAGENTVDAIPSMLTPQLHDGVAVCGGTSLCGAVFFDMARLRASRPDTDVVGFYHPYCAILDLRSCWTPMPGGLAELFNQATAKIQLVVGVVFPMIKKPIVKHDVQRMRAAIAQHALDAPFWSDGGGLLYVHQLLPHPDGGALGLSLNDDYIGNMRQTSQFVSQIHNKLRRHFGKEYLLIVTSDHPLRTSMWCRSVAYKSINCSKENFVETNNVPFMVLAPQNLAVTVPTSNVGVFSPAL